MRRFASFVLILSGTMFSVFIFVIGMYAMVPGFRQMVTSAIGRDGDIPVVSSDEAIAEDDAVQFVTEIEEEEEVPLSSGEEKQVLFHKDAETEQNLFPENEEKEPETERLIVDKEYHEDCGTGEGYWVITYDDGTTEIEQN